MLAAVEGLVLESDEVALGDGLALVRAETLQDVPDDLLADEMGTVAMLALDAAVGDDRALEDAGRRLRRLQTALRLWDDAEPSLGPTAWARTGGGAWSAVPLATGMRRDAGDCLLAADEEDPLRAFCSLVTRRTPRGGELAWALRRFELGCERAIAVEALTDWLLAGRALLADPDGQGYDGHGRAPRRDLRHARGARPRSSARLDEAIRLERAAIAGRVRTDPMVEDLIADLGGNLRAVLRDVLCGHLDPQLRRVADEMLEPELGARSSPPRRTGARASARAPRRRGRRRRAPGRRSSAGRRARPRRRSTLAASRSASAASSCAAVATRPARSSPSSAGSGAVASARRVHAVDDQAAERHAGVAQLAVEEDRLLDRVVARRGDDQERRRRVLEQRADAPGALGEAVDHPAERAEEHRQVVQQVDAGEPLEQPEHDAGAAAEEQPPTRPAAGTS